MTLLSDIELPAAMHFFFMMYFVSELKKSMCIMQLVIGMSIQYVKGNKRKSWYFTRYFAELVEIFYYNFHIKLLLRIPVLIGNDFPGYRSRCHLDHSAAIWRSLPNSLVKTCNFTMSPPGQVSSLPWQFIGRFTLLYPSDFTSRFQCQHFVY